MALEIERKWLLEAFPPMPHEREMHTEQGYLCLAPNTVRIRKREWPGGADYKMNVKGRGGLVRTEVEFDITAGEYAELRGLLVAPPAQKLYRTYPLPGGLTLECSHVDPEEPSGFLYAEVEFATEAAAHAFTPPAYLGREVTDEPGWTMAEYCAGKIKKG